jgi:hypothetical protein
VTTRSRSQDLTADLLHDLAQEEDVPAIGTPSAATNVPTAASVPTAANAPVPRADEAGSPFVETALFLAPRAWLRPGIARSGATVSLSAGPVRLRLGRR